MTRSNHTTSIHNNYASVREAILNSKIFTTKIRILSQAQEARKLKNKGKTAKQIAVELFNSDHPSNVRKVFRYLREVA